MADMHAPLADRVMQFQMLELPGQPMMMHMGTSHLVHDLWQAVKAADARAEAMRAELAWVRKNYAAGDTKEINSRIDAALAGSAS